MAITTAHLTGAAIGLGVAVAGYYVYRKNQERIDGFLRSQGLDIPLNDRKPVETMSVEELATLKERLEDLIAEKQLPDASAE